MNFPRKVSVYDIAKVAKVSTSTVSRALNNSPKISESTRRKIHDIANELRYGEGEGKKIGQSLKICLYTESWRANDLYSGMQKALKNTPHELFLYQNTLDYFDEKEFNSKEYDGVIFLGTPKNFIDKIDLLKNIEVIRVLGKDTIPNKQFGNIHYNENRVTEIMVDYLKEYGDDIYYINDAIHMSEDTLLRSHFLNYHAERRQCNLHRFTYESNKFGKDLEDFIESIPRPEGKPMLFCSFGDDVFSYLILWLSRLGLQAEKDYIIIGSNNTESLSHCVYQPATVDLQFARIGEIAVQHLLQKIRYNEVLDYKLLVEPKLVLPNIN